MLWVKLIHWSVNHLVQNLQNGYIYGAVMGNSDAMFTALPVRMR